MAPDSRGAALALDVGIAAAPSTQREFDFSDADFRSLVQIAHEQTGIALSDGKRDLVYGRLSRRLRALGFSSFRQYRDYLEGPDGVREIEKFINSISTNHTKFFREEHHFEHFRPNVAGAFVHATNGAGGGRLRVWSAGCSTGEEPYTIALVLKQEIANIARHDVRILATDIDTEVLAKGACGEYSAAALDEIPKSYRPYLHTSENEAKGPRIAMNDEVRSLIAFRRLNLIERWPFKGLFDAIFCRNVLIYFDNETKMTLIDRFVDQIRPGGWLYLGHSESLIKAHPGLRLVGRTIYRREV
jgi:chemotaxis protein methyltransferase CheR